MKAIISAFDFKKAMSIVRPCVGKPDDRPLLSFIAGRARDNKAVLTACDGYRLAEYAIEAFQIDFEEGCFWINPKVRTFFAGPQLTIETDEKNTTITDGQFGYSFRNWEGKQLDTDKLFAEGCGDIKNISFNPSLLASTVKPLAIDRQNAVVLHVGDWNRGVVLTMPKEPGYRGMILPMRVSGEWEVTP